MISMQSQTVKRKITNEQSTSNLQFIFNNFLTLQLNSPIIGDKIQPIQKSNDGQLLHQLNSVQGVYKIMRLLKHKPKIPQHKICNLQPPNKLSEIIFCRAIKYSLKDEKVFWLVKNKLKNKLKLDNPKTALVLPNSHLLTIQRKYINLYEIQQKLDLTLKDFDSSGIGKKFTFVQIKHVFYKNQSYVIIFGNQKIFSKVYFSALVFDVTKGRLNFIKKNKIIEKQIISPSIIFERYPNQKNNNEMFCLILGGISGQNYNYSGLKIDLHLFMSQFLMYQCVSTQEIAFESKRHVVTSGKAIYYKDSWYILCSEEQTINQIILVYGGPGKLLARIEIRSQKLNLRESIYFTEDSIHYVYEADEDKIVFIDKQMKSLQRSLDQLIYKLN